MALDTQAAPTAAGQASTRQRTIGRLWRDALAQNRSNPAYLIERDGGWHPVSWKEAETAVQTLGLQLRLVAVNGPDELDQAFSAIAEIPADALLVFPSPMLFAERKRIVDLGAKHRLPIIAMGKEFVQLGGLLSYGADIPDFFRRSAVYIDKILRGARPADLPVEQPTKFELFVNLRTARELGLEVPATLVARADEVIE